jgi:hypothetical protein
MLEQLNVDDWDGEIIYRSYFYPVLLLQRQQKCLASKVTDSRKTLLIHYYEYIDSHVPSCL